MWLASNWIEEIELEISFVQWTYSLHFCAKLHAFQNSEIPLSPSPQKKEKKNACKLAKVSSKVAATHLPLPKVFVGDYLWSAGAGANRETRKDTLVQPLKRIYYTGEDNPLGNEVKLRNPFCGSGREVGGEEEGVWEVAAGRSRWRVRPPTREQH